jgi:hypothetical protein
MGLNGHAWPHEGVWVLWRRDKTFPLTSGNQNLIHHLSSPSLNHGIDYTILAQYSLAFMSMKLKFF